jgi:hypothetical protein
LVDSISLLGQETKKLNGKSSINQKCLSKYSLPFGKGQGWVKKAQNSKLKTQNTKTEKVAWEG